MLRIEVTRPLKKACIHALSCYIKDQSLVSDLVKLTDMFRAGQCFQTLLNQLVFRINVMYGNKHIYKYLRSEKENIYLTLENGFQMISEPGVLYFSGPEDVEDKFFYRLLYKLGGDIRNLVLDIEVNGVELKLGEWLAAYMFKMLGDRVGFMATIDEAQIRCM